MFELVHDATDRFLLRLGLLSCHGLTSRFSICLMIAGRPVLVPVFQGLMRATFAAKQLGAGWTNEVPMYDGLSPPALQRAR